MAHNYIPLNTDLIPEETKENVPTFKLGCFSNDGKRYLIPGYTETGELAHDAGLLLSWLQWEANPQEALNHLIEEATPFVMTLDELKSNRLDVNSIWYVTPEGES